jgi:hypothetical protein
MQRVTFQLRRETSLQPEGRLHAARVKPDDLEITEQELTYKEARRNNWTKPRNDQHDEDTSLQVTASDHRSSVKGIRQSKRILQTDPRAPSSQRSPRYRQENTEVSMYADVVALITKPAGCIE